MRNTLLLLTLALSGLLTSCGDEETKRQEDPAPVTHTGQWNTIHAHRHFYNQIGDPTGSPKDETVNRGVHIVNLSEQGNYEEAFNSGKATGTYTRNNSALTLNISQPLIIKPGSYNIDSLTASRLVIRDSVMSNGIGSVFIYTMVR